MASTARTAPNLKFSHMGLSCKDVVPMEAFYTGVLGFTVTDRGFAEGMDLIFLSRDPNDHHQIVLASGRPDEMPANTRHPQFGPSINQISFLMGDLADIRDMHTRLQEGGASNIFPANHGIAWSIYCHDPEGNNLEFFMDTEWYFPQPFLIPLDLSKTDAELYELTHDIAQSQEGFVPYPEWRSRIAKKMTPFVAPTKPLAN
ncbi:VOC family protein [Novosphingobium sp.]|uniref:VOC family protein n=1 Tax=Novosphingobium sp. TaxID=1874826 RepID=UPI00286E959B|nr:VOC family protein [Novosphingobium sp.]